VRKRELDLDLPYWHSKLNGELEGIGKEEKDDFEGHSGGKKKKEGGAQDGNKEKKFFLVDEGTGRYSIHRCFLLRGGKRVGVKKAVRKPSGKQVGGGRG